MANDKLIREWNAENNGTQLAHNKFSDWDHHDYQKLLRKASLASQGTSYSTLTDRLKAEKVKRSSEKVQQKLQSEELTVLASTRDIVWGTAIDWRSLGAVGPVKAQGDCGSCWAFATASVLESAYFFKKGTYVSLSEQQMVDCAGDDFGSFGCEGGLPDLGMLYTD